MNVFELEKALSKYIPLKSCRMAAETIVHLNVHLKVTRSRTSKFGDYRAPFKGKGHRITVNNDLNPFAFLVTLVHEFAHLVTWEKHKHLVDPHGTEWKNAFREQMMPYIQLHIFPENIETVLVKYLKNPAASSCSDADLYRSLKLFDSQPVIHLENLPENTVFKLPNGMVFQKGKKLRTRYRCVEMRSKKNYLVNGLAEVEVMTVSSPSTHAQ